MADKSGDKKSRKDMTNTPLQELASLLEQLGGERGDVSHTVSDRDFCGSIGEVVEGGIGTPDEEAMEEMMRHITINPTDQTEDPDPNLLKLGNRRSGVYVCVYGTKDQRLQTDAPETDDKKDDKEEKNETETADEDKPEEAEKDEVNANESAVSGKVTLPEKKN